MAYIAKTDVNTEFGNYKEGDIVSDMLGEKYSQFVKIEKNKEAKETKNVEEVIPKTKKVKKEDKTEEILTEVSSDITIEITE